MGKSLLLFVALFQGISGRFAVFGLFERQLSRLVSGKPW
jgi:hypothetical protein